MCVRNTATLYLLHNSAMFAETPYLCQSHVSLLVLGVQTDKLSLTVELSVESNIALGLRLFKKDF